MKVKDLIKEIQYCKKKYGADFLEWDIYTEQISTIEKRDRRNNIMIKDGEGWEYFRCDGFNTIMPRERVFTININF